MLASDVMNKQTALCACAQTTRIHAGKAGKGAAERLLAFKKS